MDIKLFEDEAGYFNYPALSASQIKIFDKSRHEFWKTSPFNPNRVETKETDALIFGKLAHCLLLEPKEVNNRFKICDWGTKTRGIKYQQMSEHYPDKILISQEEYIKANTMLANVRSHRLANEILSGAVCEVPFTWSDKLTGLPCKCKVDAIKRTKNGIVIIDYKTSSDIPTLLRCAERYQYPLQDAFYCEAIKAKYGEEPCEFVFIIQSSKADEEDVVCVANVDIETQSVAKEILQARKIDIKNCLDMWNKTNDNMIWQDYPERSSLSYSQWYMRGE